MKALIKINLMNLKDTVHEVTKFENGLYYIKVPFLTGFITLNFLPNQLEIINQ